MIKYLIVPVGIISAQADDIMLKEQALLTDNAVKMARETQTYSQRSTRDFQVSVPLPQTVKFDVILRFIC